MNVFEEMLYIEEEVQVERNYQRLIKEEQEAVLNEGFIENAGIKLKLNVFRNEIANFVVDYDESVGKDFLIAKKFNLSMQAKRLAAVELASKYLAKALKNPFIKQQHDKMPKKMFITRSYGNTTITYTVNIQAFMQKYSESNCRALRNQIYKKLIKLSDKDKYAKLGGPAESIQPKKEKKFKKAYEKIASKGSMTEETVILDEELF